MEIFSDKVKYIKACSSHHFKFNYKQIMDLKVDPFVSSPVFHALGHDWIIDCYPPCSWRKNSIYFLIRLHGEYKDVNPTFRCSVMMRDEMKIPLKRIIHRGIFGLAVKKSPFRGQVFEYFNIECSILNDSIADDGTYELICSINNTEMCPNRFYLGVPKSFNLQSEIGNLLENSETADITFHVENLSFRCQRSILAARSPSPVLKAELFENMVEATQKHIKIEDILPELFKVMLHFMYTDTLPHCDSETVSAEMAQHLFVAADRYAIEGLKALCEDKLCDNISLDTISSTLALAEQHNSRRLKTSCLEFIAVPDTLMSWMLTEDSAVPMRNFPTIIAELGSKDNNISSSRDLKKRKK